MKAWRKFFLGGALVLLFLFIAVTAQTTDIFTNLRNQLFATIVRTSVTVLPRTAASTPPAPILNSRTIVNEFGMASGTVELLFVGDIMPSRFVAARMKKYGYEYPFRDTRTLLSSPDLTFGNLESPITSGRTIQNSEMVFRTDPEFTPQLAKAGVDVVSLANNHTPNFGERGLADTFRSLASSSVAFVGAGTTSRAYAPLYINAGGLRVAFVAQNDTDVVPTSYCANATRLGTACFNLERLTQAVSEARGHADFVIFTMHAGTEYKKTPNERQVRFAHAAIDAGADAVIGHHPHVIQSEETYKGKPIFYSLGNFIFDQDLSPDTQRGLVVTLHVSRTTHVIEKIERTYVKIEDYARPVVVEN